VIVKKQKSSSVNKPAKSQGSWEISCCREFNRLHCLSLCANISSTTTTLVNY